MMVGAYANPGTTKFYSVNSSVRSYNNRNTTDAWYVSADKYSFYAGVMNGSAVKFEFKQWTWAGDTLLASTNGAAKYNLSYIANLPEDDYYFVATYVSGESNGSATLG